MKEQLNKAPEEKLENSKAGPKSLALPILALVLDLLPIAAIALISFLSLPGYMILWLVIFPPIIGLVLGVVTFNRGKSVIGTAGRIIAAIAVALPLLLIGSILVFFVGAFTGLISFM